MTHEPRSSVEVTRQSATRHPEYVRALQWALKINDEILSSISSEALKVGNARFRAAVIDHLAGRPPDNFTIYLPHIQGNSKVGGA